MNKPNLLIRTALGASLALASGNAFAQSAATDTALKGQIENALKAKGFTAVTVDTTTTPATLRGTYPKNRLDEVMQTAMQAAGKPLQNQMAEAK